MENLIDMTNSNKEPFVINNQIYILGKPVIDTQTLEQLVYVLDQLGENQPVVIINPEASTIPDFNQKLSDLIQLNRRVQPRNMTSDDKYRFKDMTDAQIQDLVRDTCQRNPVLDSHHMLDMYQGLRARAQALFNLETLSKERDALWAAHCANPSSAEGSERYAELTYKLIPQAQEIYNNICKKLQELDQNSTRIVDNAVLERNTEPHPQMQQSSVKPNNTNTQPIIASNASVRNEPSNQSSVEIEYTDSISNIKISLWGPWNSIDCMVMPLNMAKTIVDSPGYAGLREQQRDVVYEGVPYKAVEPEYLIALGIDVVPDGLPIVYTDIGTFKRVGKSEQPINNVNYWYPRPKYE